MQFFYQQYLFHDNHEDMVHRGRPCLVDTFSSGTIYFYNNVDILEDTHMEVDSYLIVNFKC